MGETVVVRKRATMLVCAQCGSVYTREVSHCGLDGAPLVATNDDPLLGRTIDRYRVEASIGAGGMARVYRARHTYLEQDFALKVLHGEIASDKDLARRFQREAKTLSRIKHANVVSIADFGATPEGLLFMVMEYLDGPTLSQVLKEQAPLPPRRAARLTRQICLGLSAVHKKGYVHRDLKPGNVAVVDAHTDEETAKILDFGLVRLVEPDPGTVQLTQQGMFFGTPTYMSPEQIRGEEAGPGADLYALGVVLYQMITGNPPFVGDVKELAAQHLNSAPPRPPLAHGGLTDLALRLLSKAPADRPANASEVVAEIDELSVAPGADAPRASSRPSRRPRRRDAPEAHTVSERSPLSQPVLAEERVYREASRIEADGEVVRAALGLRAYVRGWVPLAAFALVAAAGVYYFWSGGRLPTVVQAWLRPSPPNAVAEAAPAEAAALEAAPSEAPVEAAPPSKPAPPPRTKAPKAPRRPRPQAPPDDAPAVAPAPPDDAPGETIEVTDYETKKAPEPEGPPPDAKPFSELDMNLGWALNQKGLAWADLAAVAPDAARQWTRWYRAPEAPDARTLMATFGALMDAVEGVAVDRDLLEAKLARCRRLLAGHPDAVGAPRYDNLQARYAALRRDVSFDPLRKPAESLGAEITLLEADLQVFAKEQAEAAATPDPPAPPPEPDPTTTETETASSA